MILWRTLWRWEGRGLRRDAMALAELAGFALLCVVLFSFLTETVAFPVPLLVWVILLFAGVLYVGRTFDREWAADGSRVLEGLRMIPGVLPLLFWIKWGRASLVLLGVGGFVALLLQATTPHAAPWWAWSWPPLLCGLLGFTAIGVLFAAGVVTQSRREYLLAVVCYPLTIPLILAVSQALHVGMATQTLSILWLKLTAGCALLYVVLAAALFPQMMRE